MPKRLPQAKRLAEPRLALAKIRTTQATLDSARLAAEKEGVSLSHWIELTIVARLKSTQPASEP
jgi:predicted HicB family RNase H-like nuclease